MDYYVDSLAYEACEIKLYQELEHYELKSTCIRQKKTTNLSTKFSVEGFANYWDVSEEYLSSVKVFKLLCFAK